MEHSRLQVDCPIAGLGELIEDAKLAGLGARVVLRSGPEGTTPAVELTGNREAIVGYLLVAHDPTFDPTSVVWFPAITEEELDALDAERLFGMCPTLPPESTLTAA